MFTYYTFYKVCTRLLGRGVGALEMLLIIITKIMVGIIKAAPRFFEFNITFLWLQRGCWWFTACQFVFIYVIKLGTMFAIWKIPLATRSNDKTKDPVSKQNCRGAI